MNISDEKVDELRILLEAKLGRPVTMDEAREEARCLLMLLEMLCEIQPGQYEPDTEDDQPELPLTF